MKNLKNSLILIIMTSLFPAAILAAPISHAQQLNQVRAFIAPIKKQTSYFPSEQQIQQALSPFNAQPKSSFPPVTKQPQVFINQFTTPDAPRLKQPVLQVPSPEKILRARAIHNNLMQRKYNASKRYQQTIRTPVLPHYPLPSFQYPTHKIIPNRLNTQNISPPNNNFKNKRWDKQHHILADFYTTKRNNTPKTQYKLGYEANNTHYSHTNSSATSDIIPNQFPPIREDIPQLKNTTSWDIFNQ